jgi:hypothetical protein
MDVHQRSGGMHCLHLQGRRLSPAKKASSRTKNKLSKISSYARNKRSSNLKMEAIYCCETTGCFLLVNHNIFRFVTAVTAELDKCGCAVQFLFLAYPIMNIP